MRQAWPGAYQQRLSGFDFALVAAMPNFFSPIVATRTLGVLCILSQSVWVACETSIQDDFSTTVTKAAAVQLPSAPTEGVEKLTTQFYQEVRRRREADGGGNSSSACGEPTEHTCVSAENILLEGCREGFDSYVKNVRFRFGATVFRVFEAPSLEPEGDRKRQGVIFFAYATEASENSAQYQAVTNLGLAFSQTMASSGCSPFRQHEKSLVNYQALQILVDPNDELHAVSRKAFQKNALCWKGETDEVHMKYALAAYLISFNRDIEALVDARAWRHLGMDEG